MQKKFRRDWKEAREFVQSLKLKNKNEWEKYYKSGNKPDDIPTDPGRYYKNKGWIGFGDWLGTGNISSRDRKFKPFHEARKFVHALKLKRQHEWLKYSKSGNKPDDIPASPDRTYKKNFKGYGDWLGTGNISSRDRKFKPFHEARKFVQALKLKRLKEWQEYCNTRKKPDDIPRTPHATYKNKGWTSYGDWLGTGRIATFERKYRSFEVARKFVHALKLKNADQWRRYSRSDKRPEDIPSTPPVTYKNKGWTSWGDFLGTGNISVKNRKYRSFEDARKFIHSLGLKSFTEWNAYCISGNKPDDIPTAPKNTYKNKGWISNGDWLGTGRVADQLKQYLPFSESKKYYQNIAKDNKFKTKNDWIRFLKSNKLPSDIPKHPSIVYSEKNVLRRIKSKNKRNRKYQ